MSHTTRPDSRLRLALSFAAITAMGVLIGYSIWSVSELMHGDPDAWTWKAEGLVIALGVPAAFLYERRRLRRLRAN
jgi:hypothetical protein